MSRISYILVTSSNTDTTPPYIALPVYMHAITYTYIIYLYTMLYFIIL